MDNRHQSSRINLDGYKSKPFQLFENLQVKNDSKFDKLTGTFSESPISKLYFSQENLDYLQTQIISRVYEKTLKKHVIGRQSDDEIIIVMRSIYLQHGKNSNSNIDIQINILNELVLDYCVNNVYTNLVQHFEYINDITRDQPVLDMPETTHIKGSKMLMPNHFF
jgi:SPX domain protein involved in polyphosphate accumulation